MEIKSKDIKLVNLNELKPFEKNPNRHSKEQIERLCKLIKYQGFRVPLIVDQETNTIATGHGRYEAAKKLNLEKVPVIFQKFDNYDQFYAFVVSDNAVTSWDGLDLGMINLDLKELDGMQTDLDFLGFKKFSLDISEKENNKNKKEKLCPYCGMNIDEKI